jgi:hypothetical protein
MFVVEHSASRPLYVHSFVLAVYRLRLKCRRVWMFLGHLLVSAGHQSVEKWPSSNRQRRRCGESQRESGVTKAPAGRQWWGEHHCQSNYVNSTCRAVLVALSEIVPSERKGCTRPLALRWRAGLVRTSEFLQGGCCLEPSRHHSGRICRAEYYRCNGPRIVRASCFPRRSARGA